MTRSFFLFILSGFLLVFLFPNISWSFLGWMALVPLWKAIDDAPSRLHAMAGAWLSGLIFFAASMSWLNYVHPFGWVCVAFIESLSFILLGAFAYEGKRIKNGFLKTAWLASSWLLVELARSEMPIFGLPWNLLGNSQANQPVILQSANTIGVYGLGFLIAGANAFWIQLAGDLKTFFEEKSGKAFKSFLFKALFGMVLAGAVWSHGIYHLNKKLPEESAIRISILQGNIPQDEKWQTALRDQIVQIYLKLSELAVGKDKPDLIIWPEASFPGYLNRDARTSLVQDFVRKFQTPILIGSPHYESDVVVYNAAYLMEKTGEFKEHYDKQYLVPFGEYVPLKLIFGWLEPIAYALGISDFSSGTHKTVFGFAQGKANFSTLICFEDVFSSLAREFVDRGARFLVVMTNDAWFGVSQAPYQHLQASILRAVENGVPVIRAANTGVSAFISPQGQVISRVQDETGKDIFYMGYKTETLNISENKTLFRRGGFLFPYIVSGVLLLVWAIMFFRRRVKTQFPSPEGNTKAS